MSPPISPPPAPSVLPFAARGRTDPGRQRQHNEDAFGVFPHLRLAVLADGMGGRSGGAVAAQLAVDAIGTFFEAQQASPRSPWPFPIDKTLSRGVNLLRVGLQVANRRIRETATTDPGLHRMAATVAALAVGATQVVTAHAGDVRIYRLRSGVLTALTRDHSVVEEMRTARPDLSKEQLAAFGHRHVVTKAVGTKEELEPTVTSHTLERNDSYLLCCDGLWNALEEQTIADIINGTPDLDQACHTLIEAANEAGGADNITAVLVRVG